MKFNIKNIAVCIAAASTVVACDLDTSPTTDLDAGSVFKDLKNTEYAFHGIWNYIINSGYHQASPGLGSIFLSDDFSGSDAVWLSSYGDFSDSYNLEIGYGRGVYGELLWDIAYTGINNCNAILANIDNVDGDDTQRAVLKGQTYATRGYLYMLLASHYSFAIDKDPNAVCVPIYLKPSTVSVALTGEPASNVTEVYNQALSDLRLATENIPEDYANTATVDKYKPDYATACGLLARTALYAREWQEAYDNASTALNKNSYLMTEEEYKAGFSDCSNKEWIWGSTQTISDNSAGKYLFAFKDCVTAGGYSNLGADPYFVDLYEDGDYRADLFFQGVAAGQGSNAGPKVINKKFVYRDPVNYLADIVLMRTSEMMLVKAEAATYLPGKEQEAQQLLFDLRKARMKQGHQPAAVTATGDELRQEIWKERRKELWGEGFALTDIIRNQQSVERKNCYVDIVDDEGKSQRVNIGHDALKFPDGSNFVPNSKYYLFRIEETEELQNVNLYSKYPKLDIYR